MLSRFFDLTRQGVMPERAEIESKAHKGGGGGTQTVKNDPPAWSIPYLTDISSQASSLSKRPQQYFPGSTVVPFSGQTQRSMRMLEQFSGSDPIYGRAGLDSVMSTARGDFLNSNPYLDSALNAATRPVVDQVNAQFSTGGRYGSAGHAGAIAQQLGDIRTQAYADNYARERQNMMDAGKFLPLGQGMFDQSQLGRVNALQGVGGALEGKSGEYLQDNIARWDFAQNEPWNRLQRYASIINPGAGLGSTQTTTMPGGSRFGGALGGGVAGAALGSMVPGFGGSLLTGGGGALLGPAGWVGLGLGALGGGLF